MEPMVFAMQRLNKNHTMSDTKRYEIVVCTGKHSRDSRLRILPLVPVPQENFAWIFVGRIESYLNLRQRGENNNEPPAVSCSRFSSPPYIWEYRAKENKFHHNSFCTKGKMKEAGMVKFPLQVLFRVKGTLTEGPCFPWTYSLGNDKHTLKNEISKK